ncbi:unnamed protein product [Acanthoscelides obtectus]|uniref:Uncharacterized protein n=1 Tax=Acanthoscelides obtectus TaxID=200917 RepID=A0A9P0Q0L5_ACAOB|nr:unnamed protein product [Acanthoscelides obtectus]CAK1634536.1 hypothetical protein AOBTE_LOCUS8796 [Acanthoscelides obtectus]
MDKPENPADGKYPDGTTFNISGSLDKVDYKRSDSGAMVLEMELGQSKKYREYKEEELDTAERPHETEFVLKYNIHQNDKACQTDEGAAKIENGDGEAAYMQIKYNSDNATPISSISCGNYETACTRVSDPRYCRNQPRPSEISRPHSTLTEVVWKYDGMQEGRCSQCGITGNNKGTTSDNWDGEEEDDGLGWNSKRLRNIWDGDEIYSRTLLGGVTHKRFFLWLGLKPSYAEVPAGGSLERDQNAYMSHGHTSPLARLLYLRELRPWLYILH